MHAYGVVLFVHLTALTAAFGADGVICAAHDGAPADEGTPCPQHLCCLAAHIAQPLAAPVPPAVAMVVPFRREVAQVWRVAERPPVRGPPNRAVSSRGPPAA